MGINLYCPSCYKCFKIGTKKCNCMRSFKKNRHYRVRIKVNGKWKTKTVSSFEKAKLIEAEFHLKVQNEQKELSTSEITIETVWQYFFAWAKLNKRSWIDDKIRWEKHISPYISGKISNIKPHHIQFVLTNMAQMDSQKGGKYKPGTIKLVFALIKRVINWSIEQGYYLGHNPCKRIKLPYFDNRITNPLNQHDLQSLLKILEKWENKRPVYVIKFALYSGKRRGEILSLTWDCVDLENGFVKFKSTNTKNKKTQILPLNKTCKSILEECNKITISDFVFSSATGKYYHSFPRTWVRIKKRANINIRFHDLRHTYASYLASSGKVDIYTLKELLGHSTIEMTQRYAHLVNGALRKAVCVADEVF